MLQYAREGVDPEYARHMVEKIDGMISLEI
jgi:hypothetical protein